MQRTDKYTSHSYLQKTIATKITGALLFEDYFDQKKDCINTYIARETIDKADAVYLDVIVNDSLLFGWGKLKNMKFTEHLNIVRKKVVCWKKNTFLLPSREAEKDCIEELVRLINDCTNQSATKDVDFKAIMAMASFLLQKPSKNSKAKDHLQGLKKRLKDCLNDDISELLHEEETNQKNIMKLNWPKNVNSLSQTFADFVVKGNVKSAIKLLKKNMENENLP